MNQTSMSQTTPLLLRAAAALVLSGAAVLLPAAAADAATVLLKGGETVYGRVVSRSLTEVVVETPAAEGGVRRRTISADEVEDVLESVSPARLTALRPESPREYRLYAEELAEKRADPEARETAIRLYLIAAALAPDELGRSCLLGMADLARSDAERRRFRAMAFLLDSAHDRRLLGASAPAVSAEGEADQELLRIVRLLRAGRRREAERLLQSEGGEAQRRRLDQLLPAEDVPVILSRLCPRCTNGYQTCGRCGGDGELDSGADCPQCRIGRTSRGRIPCPVCGGDYRDPAISREHLLMLVETELKLMRLSRTATAGGSDVARWTDEQSARAPVRGLTLSSVTEFDPQQSVYRDGRWQKP